MAALKMSNEVLQEQLKKGPVGSEQISDNRRGTSSESVVVTACEASKSEVNINSLRNIPEVAASAAALLNAYFPNLEGQNSALTGSVGFTQRSSTTPQTVMTPSVSRAMPNRGMGGLTCCSIQDLHRPMGQGQQHTMAGQGSGMVQNAVTGYSSEQSVPSFLGQQSSMQFTGHEGNVSSSRVKSGADLVYRENFKQQIAWPHLCYESIDCNDKLAFNDLTCDMLAAGEIEIIQSLLEKGSYSNEPTRCEVIGRLSRLKETMYFTRTQGFERAKRYFELTGKRVEAGGRWDDDNRDIYVRSALPAVNQFKLEAGVSQKSNDDKFNGVCMSWNHNIECAFLAKNGRCSKAHICCKCIKRGETSTHKALDCTFGQTGVETTR